MNVGTKIHNFTVKRVREFPEIPAKLWELEHDKNGAQLCWLERADENKTFSIAFKTTPEDHTGVFHIIEHSVLCGSDKYPVKEPFVDLLKSSVQTFLNAITFGDKTVYPVSSRNDKDFLNLISVYMDAVLHPSLIHKPEIFRQEGWRYELGEGRKGVYQGVVFNEMKGSMATAPSILYNELGALVFPDNCYRFNSGGDPAYILDLSYEQFKATHQKYYHPSNARISLVGSVDLDAVLGLVDSYLNDFARLDVDFAIPMQQPVPHTTRETLYEIGPEEPENERYVVAGAKICGRFDEQKKNFAAKVLADYLAGDNEGPVKRAILDAQLGQEVDVMLEDGAQQSTFAWTVWNTGRDKVDEIRRTVRETAEKLVREGLDRERLEACVNRFAFHTRDRDGGWGPRSLGEALGMLDSWLYGGDPIQPLLVDESLEALTREMDTGYYEALLRELLLDEGGAQLLLVPSKTLGEERRAKEAARYEAESAAWTEERLAELREQAAVLTAWQQSEDTPEAKATIPVLQLSDLNEAPERLPMRVEKSGETTVLRHALDSKIVYARMHFAASDLSLEELPYLEMLGELLGTLPTAHYDSAALQTRIKQKLGSLSFGASVRPGRDAKSARVSMIVSAALLEENLDEARALIEEILLCTVYTDTKIAGDVLKQAAMSGQMALTGRGNMYALMRASAQTTSYGVARETMSGYSYLKWLKDRSQEDESALKALLDKLQTLAGKLFCRERLTLSLSDKAGAGEDWMALVPTGGETVSAPASYEPLPRRREGILIPADVGFAAKAGDLKLYGASYHGSLPALTTILNFDYLWGEIRVQGGAYGCGFLAREEGEIGLYSYRDPQPGRSLGVFDAAEDFIRKYCAQGEALTRAILGSVGDLDPLRNAQQKMTAAESFYFQSLTQDERDRHYRELLHTTSEDLLRLCDTLRALAQQGSVCVVAGQAQLDACGEQLEEILKL